MDALLDIEKRTGVSEQDLEAFERSADEISKLIAGLKDGTIDPEEVKIPGEKTAEEIEREKLEAERKRLEQLEKEWEEKEQERKDWWDKAECLRGMTRQDAKTQRLEHIRQLDKGNRRNISALGKVQEQEKLVITDDDGNILFPKPKTKSDALDYSVWDRWIPDDPVSLEEMQRAKDQIEQERNDEFERNNPEFCRQFKQDQEKRIKDMEKKETDAEKLKLRGNNYFKRKDFAQALKEYHNSLRVVPWGNATLCNIAQVYLRTTEFNEAMEFSERALFLDPENVKALWRHAQACLKLGNLEEAVLDLNYANLLEPENGEIAKQLNNARQELFESKAENVVSQKLRDHQDEESKSNNKKRDEHTIAKQIAQIMEHPTADLTLPQKMCDEIVKGKDLKSSMLPVASTLAVDGLINLLETTKEEDQAQVRVLLRTSGALLVLSSWMENGVGGAKVGQLIVDGSVPSKRNMEELSQHGFLTRILGSCRCPKSTMEALIPFAQEEAFAPEICDSTAVFERIGEFLHGGNESDHEFSVAAHLLSSLCAINGACREKVVSKHLTNAMMNDLVRGLSIKNRLDNACAAIANLCQHEKPREMIDALTLVNALGAKPEKDESIAYLLAALLNLSFDVNNASRELMGNNVHILTLLYQYIVSAKHTRIVRSRAAALLSRLMTDKRNFLDRHNNNTGLALKEPNVLLELCEELVKQTGTDASEHVMRCIAAFLRVVDPRQCKDDGRVLHILSRALKQQASLAQQGNREIIKGTDQYTANLAQCFVQLTNYAKYNEAQDMRDYVIPNVVRLIQITQDGPIRKNCAIALAKLAKSGPKNLQLIRELRGMEMLVELGGRLV